MLLAQFPSSRNPEIKYRVYGPATGVKGISCSCPGFENHEQCWHVSKIKSERYYKKTISKLIKFQHFIDEQWNYIEQYRKANW